MPAGQFVASVQVGDWVVEPALDTISRSGEVQKLEPRTMRLLMCLVDSAGSVVSIDRLLNDVWTGVIVGSASVYQAVSQLRKILGDTDPEPTYIATVPRKGYRLIAPVRRIESPGPVPPDAIAAPLAASQASRRSWWIAASGIALLAMIGVGSLLQRKSPQSEASASIVVLPFVDMTAEKKDQPFCDGLTEELANWLAQIPSLRVVARTSAFAFRGQGEDVRKIGKSLDTNNILEGSMRRSGDHMRVTVQLIDARSGYHLWSANYDRPIADTINMQEEISRSVAENMQVRLTTDTSQRFAARRSANPQAYQTYLLARHFQQDRTQHGNDQAIQLYRQVLLADPKFALAYVGLAYALLNENYLSDRAISDIAAEAAPLLETALKLDPNLSDIYAVRGALLAELFRNDAALADFRRAVMLNPSDATAFAEMGRLFLFNGQPQEGLTYYSQAVGLDPLNSQPQAYRCLALQDLGLYDEAANSCARARELQPKAYWPLAVTSMLMAAQGRLDEALTWNAMSLKAAPDVFALYADRAHALLILGLPARARETLESARVETKQEDWVNDELARVAYYEGGAAALSKHLAATRLDDSSHAIPLMSLAYYQLMIGDAVAAKRAMDRAFKATDFSSNSLDSPLEAARGGHSDELTAALVDIASGDRPSAMRRLDTLSAMLDKLVRNGEKRYGVDELRAAVFALQGDAVSAVAALTRAAEAGWRRSWWAQREPDLASLWARNDFRALMARIDKSNSEMALKVTQ
jgi:transcriptional activator of cad operon